MLNRDEKGFEVEDAIFFDEADLVAGKSGLEIPGETRERAFAEGMVVAKAVGRSAYSALSEFARAK